jgi:hypothetical protein
MHSEHIDYLGAQRIASLRAAPRGVATRRIASHIGRANMYDATRCVYFLRFHEISLVGALF